MLKAEEQVSWHAEGMVDWESCRGMMLWRDRASSAADDQLGRGEQGGDGKGRAGW